MDFLEQEIQNEINNREHPAEKCYQCGEKAELKAYTIRQNYSNRVIWCCSEQCADHAQMGAE